MARITSSPPLTRYRATVVPIFPTPIIAVVIVSSFLDDFADTARALAHARFHLWCQTASPRSYCASPSCFMKSWLSQNSHSWSMVPPVSGAKADRMNADLEVGGIHKQRLQGLRSPLTAF